MLKDKTAALTGSTSGIGLAIARAYAEQGANIGLDGIRSVSPIADFPTERRDAISAINLSASCHAIRAAQPRMKAGKRGRISNGASCTTSSPT